MEVVRNQPPLSQTSAWTTPLCLASDNPLPQPAMQPSPNTSPIFDSQQQPPPPSSLTRSESAPLNILDANSNPPISDSPDSDLPPLQHPMNFAAAAATGVSSPPSSTIPHPTGQRRPPPAAGPPKPPPPRSLSSVELAGIVSARSSTVSAVPARLQSKPASSVPQPSPPVKGKKTAAPAWHKSVFDMIQDDFPRTPSPMFSSLLATSRANNAPPQELVQPREHLDPALSPSERRNRLPSTASLDIDLDRLRVSPEPTSEISTLCNNEEDVLSSDPPARVHHRRSVSINWTGDVSALPQAISRSSSRSNLASSPAPAYFPTKHAESTAASSSAASVVPAATSLNAPIPSAVDPSAASSPTQSLSPTSSSGRGALAPQPLASPTMSLPVQMSNSVTAPPSQHRRIPYAIPNPSDPLASSSMDELNVPGLADYDYLYDQSENAITSSSAANSLSPFPTAAYSSSNPTQIGASGIGNVHGQPIGLSSQYSNVFPGMGLFPSPFSNTAGGIGNGAGVAPVYTDSFRDGLAAADNLKNMSIQMAAFLSAQQQLYAAQMAQMVAMTGNSAFSGNPTGFGGGTIPGATVAHTGSVSHGAHMRNPWDSREPSPPPHRNMPRSKHHFDQYRGGAGSHIGGQKKGVLDAGHKGRGRGRRGHRGHDDVGMIGNHKASDRIGLTGGSLGSSIQDAAHARSPLLEEFRATSLSIGRSIGVSDIGINGSYGPGGSGSGVANGREWQLSQIKDNVVEFATDQHGSRFIQQKLESASAEDKDSILKHALTDAQRLMTDVFGNYVVQKLLDHGGENAVKLIAGELEGRMLVLSLHMYGCRVVQKALEVLESGARAKLVRELDGHVLKCIRDQNGNHVIQKCVELVEPDSVQFIVDSVQGQAVVLAGHSYGCRVVQRILEHGAPDQKAPIMVEIMSCIAELIKDQYGNYVIQHVVEHGTVEERSIIMNLVRGEVCQLSQHKFASNVVERCLQFGSLEERQVLIEILIVGEGAPNSSPLNHLVRDQFGNYVVQRVLDVALPPQRERVVTILRAQVPAIKKYSYGKHIIARLEEHQGSSGSSVFHHSQNAHVHSGGGGGQTGLHRGERHVGPSMMPVGVSHGLPQSPQDFMYYE